MRSANESAQSFDPRLLVEHAGRTTTYQVRISLQNIAWQITFPCLPDLDLGPCAAEPKPLDQTLSVVPESRLQGVMHISAQQQADTNRPLLYALPSPWAFSKQH
jgi:hypothetical protein